MHCISILDVFAMSMGDERGLVDQFGVVRVTPAKPFAARHPLSTQISRDSRTQSPLSITHFKGKIDLYICYTRYLELSAMSGEKLHDPSKVHPHVNSFACHCT